MDIVFLISQMLLMLLCIWLGALVLDQFASHDITPRDTHRTNQLTFMERMVKSGKTVSFLPASAAVAHPTLALRPLDPVVAQEVLLAYRPGFTASPRVQQLLDRVAHTIAESSESRGS